MQTLAKSREGIENVVQPSLRDFLADVRLPAAEAAGYWQLSLRDRSGADHLHHRTWGTSIRVFQLERRRLLAVVPAGTGSGGTGCSELSAARAGGGRSHLSILNAAY